MAAPPQVGCPAVLRRETATPTGWRPVCTRQAAELSLVPVTTNQARHLFSSQAGKQTKQNDNFNQNVIVPGITGGHEDTNISADCVF